MGQFTITASVFATTVMLIPSLLMAADFPFEFGEVKVENISLERQFEGTVEAINKTTVSAQTSGRIILLDFDVDDFVEQGTVIVRFSNGEHMARLDQATSSLTAAKARSKAAGQDFDRVDKLYKNGTVARARFDEAKSSFDAAVAEVDNAEAAVKQAQEQLSYTTIRAPYSGLVAERHVQIGETVNPGTPLMTGFSLERLRVRSEVPEQFAQKIRASNKAVVMSTGGERIAVGRLTVFPFADPKSNTVSVRLGLPIGIKSVFPGMLVKAQFKIGESNVLVMPAEAVVARGEVTGAYLAGADGRLRLQQIRIGRMLDSGGVLVLAGLKEGDRVALDPLKAAIYLKDEGAKK